MVSVGTSVNNKTKIPEEDLKVPQYSKLSGRSYYLDLTPSSQKLTHKEMCNSQTRELTNQILGVQVKGFNEQSLKFVM